jgi:putrescine transport system substrate-binding protein
MQVKRGLYQAIPKAKLKNYGNLDPLLLKQLDLFDPGNVYGVPYMWGTTGVAFNVDAIKGRMPDAPTDSWKMIFDPAVVSKFKDCGVAMVDAGDDVVQSALIYLGRDPNSESPDGPARSHRRHHEGPAVSALLPLDELHRRSRQRRNLSGTRLFGRRVPGDAQCASGREDRLSNSEEGAIVWIDVMAIPKGRAAP